jgi:hypothetical protein
MKGRSLFIKQLEDFIRRAKLAIMEMGHEKWRTLKLV